MQGPRSTAAGESDAETAGPSERSRSPLEGAADAALRALSHVPPLAMLALAAALAELVLARFVWHGFTETLPTDVLILARRWARFPRNLAAVAGLFALVWAIFGFLRHPGYAPIGRRLVVAAFSGIFVPSIAVAALIPAALLRRNLVLFALAAANVLVILIGMTAVRYRAGRAVRAAVGLATASCLLSLSIVGLGLLLGAQRGILGRDRRAPGPEPGHCAALLDHPPPLRRAGVVGRADRRLHRRRHRAGR